MKAELDNKLIAVIRVRGRSGVRRSISETMNRLNLRRVNNLALIFGTKANIGMIEKCKDFVTYGQIKEDTLVKLLEKKGSKAGKADAQALMSGKKVAKEIAKIPIPMHPPRRGYEGIKRGYSTGGALGYRGEDINELISRMS
ncbi:MAG: uL30 family ribosomal protein [Candidatus Micrarchaeota archaeon]|nr:uL30 family ribosomal protein [Candidatus Micrarchaeota archaeon]MDE1834791.1 uL30 family ribosomal protein [Candidatus Micrarchaeota archaeon]MDE1859144.1 uL30 family ribosomal protein [Candidatus Micrarchaeota archaeon]